MENLSYVKSQAQILKEIKSQYEINHTANHKPATTG